MSSIFYPFRPFLTGQTGSLLAVPATEASAGHCQFDGGVAVDWTLATFPLLLLLAVVQQRLLLP
jgi:hypothetical protein